ncbi:MAG TPA: SRPBCC family protein [Anaerolineales bacterium]|nr:SRPBCC family protein [Anaerolineales bacterium]
MKQGTFENEVFIQAKPDQIIPFLVDHRNHVRFHPLITAVDEVPPPAGALRRFFITDQLIWGPFHFKIKYRADVIRTTENEMLTEAYQSPGTYITNHSTFMAEGNGTRMHETITLKAPNLLFGYAFSQAKSAHGALVQRVKQVIEADLTSAS